ncbi:MAG TPA: pitrilysin family protein, partial [Pyrinomonadaceae bacterium]|nr:pitrilysin family protein [Pyrinomonadaceae bacterium]
MKAVSHQRSAVNKLILLLFVFLTFTSDGFAQTGRPSITQQANLVTELDVNGLKVLVKRRPNAPTVAAGLFIRGGSRNITDKTAGIEGLMLNVATTGSKKFPREAVRRELARTGSSIGSAVSNDYSAISLASTRQNFDRSWEIFTDLVLNPAFATEDIERARAQISTGLREQETNSDNFLQILQDRVIYANHPYANDVNGTLETISRFSAKDLSDYHKKMMETSRLLLVVVGDIDPKDVESRVAATLGKLPRGSYKEAPYP